MMNKKEFYDSLPKKRMAAGALFLDQDRNILMVKPAYKDYWHLPGGLVEQDESPYAACVREVREETGLEMKNGRLLTVDYSSADSEGRTEHLEFIFYGGLLENAAIKKIQCPEGEIEKYGFIPENGLSDHTVKRIADRIVYSLKALKDKSAYYLENQAYIGKK